MSQAEKMTPAQAAKHLTIHGRTLRRWASAFSKSLTSSAAKRGAKRYFTGADIGVLIEAQRLLADGRTIPEVADLLPTAENVPPASALVLSVEQGLIVGQTLERTRHLGLVSQDHDQRIQELESALLRLRWERLPFWKKLRTPPPPD